MTRPRRAGWVSRVGLVLALHAIVGCALLPELRLPIAEADAIGIARDAAPDLFRDEPVRSAALRPYREVASEHAPVLSVRPPRPDQLVWVVDLGSESAPLMGSGAVVVLDGVTGEVMHVTEWIS